MSILSTAMQMGWGGIKDTMRLGAYVSENIIPQPGVLGWAASFGFEPAAISDTNHPILKGWGHEWDLAPPNQNGFLHLKPTDRALAAANEPFWSVEKMKSKLPGATPLGGIGAAANVYFAYQGYKEGGFSGAYDVLALNAAVESSMYKWSYGIGTAKEVGGKWLERNAKVAGHPLVAGASNPLLRGVGAYLGGSIGQQIGLATHIPLAGTAGATIGAYIGGAPIQALMSRPLLVTGALATGAAVGAAYGAYYTVKTGAQMGYAHRQSMRGVNTDGSMAAFMTQNALTMRERSVQAIAKSHLNARSALGQEASFMHSPRNYNSMYR